jgi:hypothetical protein|tara:strand:- start:5389 stop:5826 length:438 start_codon:yes stop_codon:yes gene_type:complete
MKTGMDNTVDKANKAAIEYMEAMTGIVMPVLERSVILAAEYSKACGRNVVLSQDVQYASRYCAMHTVGQVIGSLFPGVYDSDDSDDSDIEVVPENELPEFKRYRGNNPLCNQINQAYDNWSNWEPRNPAEQILKIAINKDDSMGA